MEELFKSYMNVPKMKSITVYEHLKLELLTGKWEFGEKILVNELIEKFNVSRRPVMDAMKMLESHGFIEIIPQSGCKVIDYSRKNILDQLLLSSVLESLSAELAAINHKQEEIIFLENLQTDIKKNPDLLKDKYNYLKYTREFHYSVLNMTHSEIIKKNTLQIWELTDFYLINSFDHFMFAIEESLDYHDDVLQFIKDRNAKKAKEAMEKNTMKYIDNLKNYLP